MREIDLLTEDFIRNAEKYPANLGKRFRDGAGLYLYVLESGYKSWRYIYKFGDKQKILTIGSYPEIGTKQAREARIKARGKIINGIDPCAEKRAAIQQRKFNSLSFAEVANEWYQLQTFNLTNKKHIQQIINTLRQYAFPYIGNKHIAQISPLKLLEILKQPALVGKTETAKRVRQRLKAVFDYAVLTGKITHNPATPLPRIMGGIKNNQPALPKERLVDFFQKLEKYPNRITQLSLQLLILTFVRSGELRKAEWSEIHGNEWHIPREKMKMKRPHIVPLSNWALEILEELKSLSTNHLIIHGRNNQVISDSTFPLALRRMGYQGIATPHGFRAMASTILNESGLFTPDAIERQLAHAEQNKIRDAYNRGDYLEERHRMMQWYSDYIKKQYLIAKGEL